MQRIRVGEGQSANFIELGILKQREKAVWVGEPLVECKTLFRWWGTMFFVE